MSDSRLRRLQTIVQERSLIRAPPGEELRLASGATSSFYFDMKRTVYNPEGAYLVADLILDALEGSAVDAVGGLEVGAVPIASAVALRSHERGPPVRGFHVRKAPKDHGSQRSIEGYLERGWTVALLEDVTTTGGSALRAVEAVAASGCTIDRVITIVDRLQGAAEAFAAKGLRLQPLLTTRDFDLA